MDKAHLNHHPARRDFTRMQRGFTLVELMIALVLSLFLVGGVILMYGSGRAAIDDGQRLSRLQENMRFAAEFMIRDIRQAGFCTTETNCAQVEPNFAVVIASPPELRVRYVIPEADRRDCTGTALSSGEITTNRYTLSGGSLRCNNQALIDGVNSLQFQEIRDGGNNLIGVEVILGFDPGGTFGTQEMSFVVALRNRILAPLWD